MDSFFIIVIRYKTKNNAFLGRYFFIQGGIWGSNPRPSEPQSDALTN